MARPKRTAAAAAQTGAAQTRTAEVKKAAEVKSTAEVKTAEDVKKADEPAVKEAVKETVKPEIEKSVVVEFGGRQVAAKVGKETAYILLAQAEKAYAKTHPGTVIKSMELYISPEQNAAYYVVNGEGSDDFRIDL